MATVKKARMTLWTPPGRVSFPFFAAPDQGRQYSDNKYKADLLIKKEAFKTSGKALQAAVLDVGKQAFGPDFKFGGKWKTPFKDTDKDDKVVNDIMKGCIMLRAKSTKAPMFIGPRKDPETGRFPELTEEEILAIKGGDWCVFNVTVYPYDQSGGGITLGLNAVQFWKSDTGFGQGRSVLLTTANELEVELDSATDTTVAPSSDADDSVV